VKEKRRNEEKVKGNGKERNNGRKLMDDKKGK
jgi:hypothetical protein